MPRETELVMASRQVEKLAYVTEHFRDMRSMIAAPAVVLLTLWAHWARLGWDRGDRRREWAYPILLLLGVLIGKRIHNWYRDNFGFVQPEPSRILNPKRRGNERPDAWIYGAMFLAFGTSPMSHADGWTVGALQIMAAALYLLVPRCTWSVPLTPSLYMRKLLGWAGVLAVFGAVCIGAFTQQQGMLLLDIASGSFLVMAVYDHWLLTHVLPAPRKEALHG
jgi:hypothetical protein